MPSSLPGTIVTALVCACAALPAAAVTSACAAGASRASSDTRILRAIDEARRQHQAFGGQTIERNGGMFRSGHHEAEWSRAAGEPQAPWQRVAKFWNALSESEPPRVMTSAGWIAREDALRGTAAAGGDASRSEVALRESLLRAAIVDTPWSAAFISYLMKTAGFSRAEFAFSDTHADYVQSAFEASAAESVGQTSPYAFRACDVLSTRPRAGDLLCATRADTAGIARFDGLAAAMQGRSPGQDFPMHCELVVRSDEGGDAKIDAIGGNVVQSVTLTRMTLNADKVLGAAYLAASPSPSPQGCGREEPPCRGHLGRRPWLVLLQFRL